MFIYNRVFSNNAIQIPTPSSIQLLFCCLKIIINSQWSRVNTYLRCSREYLFLGLLKRKLSQRARILAYHISERGTCKHVQTNRSRIRLVVLCAGSGDAGLPYITATSSTSTCESRGTMWLEWNNEWAQNTRASDIVTTTSIYFNNQTNNANLSCIFYSLTHPFWPVLGLLYHCTDLPRW